jgi:hypothetical protein
MCRRDSTDQLVRNFLDHYQVNLLAMPGRRVTCGSVYIKEGKRVTAPGSLADIVEPAIELGQPFHEPDLADLSGTWSGSVTLNAGIGLLRNFLTALGAAGLIDKLQASVQQANVHSIAFRFREVSRDSLVPTSLAAALIGHRLARANPWVRDGNHYFAVAAVLRSRSISIQGRDGNDTATGLGAGVATVADVDLKVRVERESESQVTYTGPDALAIGVELYEVCWDDTRQEFAFHTPKGPLHVVGLTEDQQLNPAYLGDDEDAFIAPEEPADDPG